jgi:hypothetical protein
VPFFGPSKRGQQGQIVDVIAGAGPRIDTEVPAL